MRPGGDGMRPLSPRVLMPTPGSGSGVSEPEPLGDTRDSQQSPFSGRELHNQRPAPPGLTAATRDNQSG